ncbi:MAG: ABC transporter ATP-binding protein [Burkholderiales bacterium]|nr:ABC transporter ATP-binding protein [Burkholderiales bacterium]
MTEDRVIELRDVHKSYSLETRPWHRLWYQLRGRQDRGPQHHALQHADLIVRRGEVVGVIGRNGAGKSTLLQLVCGVLQPTRGECVVHGRIAALLELGAGFNPELTGRENVRLNGPLLGLSPAQIEQAMGAIIDFAGIGAFIDQPVRSYSSGMFMRLAFSMATSVDPDILVIDEALSVGDGAFAHKSFERIMALKERGATIIFCSHSMFQVESLCTRAIWIEGGRIRADGPAHRVTVEYSEWLQRHDHDAAEGGVQATRFDSEQAGIVRVQRLSPAGEDVLRSGQDSLALEIVLKSRSDAALPTLGVVLHGADGRSISSAGSWLDGVALARDANGQISVQLCWPALPLLKGRYTISVYVLCDRAINLWAAAEHVLAVEIVQEHLEQGVVSLPHQWMVGAVGRSALLPSG